MVYHTSAYLEKKQVEKIIASINYRICKRCGNCKFVIFKDLSNTLDCGKHELSRLNQMGVCDDHQPR